MKRRLVTVIITMLLAAGITACGSGEREALRARVAELEQQLVRLNSELADKDAAITELRTLGEETQAALKKAEATRDAQAAELVKLRAELGKLKAQLKKRR